MLELLLKSHKSHLFFFFFFGTGIDWKQNCLYCKMKKKQKPKGGENLQFFIIIIIIISIIIIFVGLSKVEDFH